jgi:hypothetical protein
MLIGRADILEERCGGACLAIAAKNAGEGAEPLQNNKKGEDGNGDGTRRSHS